MNPKKFFLLIGAAIVALIAAYVINSANKPQSDVSAQDQTLLPPLHAHLNDVNAITLTGASDKLLVALKRGDAGWVVANNADYPADLTKIRELLIKLEQSTILEHKTSNPALYAELGVDDVKDAAAKGVMVELSGLPKPLKLIVGNYNGGGGGGTFVRLADNKQTLLASSTLTIAKEPSQWENLNIADIPSSRFQSIVLTNTDGKTLKVDKDAEGDANFKVTDMPKGRELTSDYAPNELASVLSGLRASDVVPAKTLPAPDKTDKVQYNAFDGLVIDATGWQKDGKDYAQFKASLDDAKAGAYIDAEQAKAKAAYEAGQAAEKKADADKAKTKTSNGETAAKPTTSSAPVALAVTDPAKDKQQKLDALNKQIAALNQTFDGWTFTLPSYKYADMNKTMDDLLKPLPKKAVKAGHDKKRRGKTKK